MSEITTEKAVSIGLMANWFWTIIMALITRPLLVAIGGWLFIIFAAILFSSVLFVLFIVKETKGKSESEVASLYTSQQVFD